MSTAGPLRDPPTMDKDAVEDERDLLRQIADERPWTQSERKRFADLERGPGGFDEAPPPVVTPSHAIGPLRDPATCRHAVHTSDQRYGKDLDKSPVMRGTCMWCDTELKAPLGAGWGVGSKFAVASPVPAREPTP